MIPILDISDKTAELNLRFADYLADKSVAIVGRANLHELEQGCYIDSHDVVVRMHRIIPYTDNHVNERWSKNNIDESYIPKDWQSRIGKKCNIHYHRYGHKLPLMRRHIISFKKAGGRFYCFEDPAEPAYKYGLLHEYGDVRYVPMSHYFDIANRIGGKVLPGTLIITDILRQPVKRAYITGFPCYFDDAKVPPDKGNLPNLAYLAKLCRHPRVSCDSLMRGLYERILTNEPNL